LGFAHAILPKEMPSLIGTSLAFPGSGLDQAQPCPRTIRRLIAWTILPVSTAAGGALAGTLDPGYVLASLGLIWAVFCAAQLFNPYLLRIEDKDFP
jgi:hypothetical protein